MKTSIASTIWLCKVSAALVVCGVMHYLITATHPVNQTPRVVGMIDVRVPIW